MRYVRWGALFAAVAVVVACTPFNKPLQSDGGAGSAGTSGSVSGNGGGSVDAAIESSIVSKGQNGGACTFDTDCGSGHCAEGVCCESACTATCVSCRSGSTSQPDGKCAPVKAGSAHGNDCAQNTPATCGLTGKCNGAGACQFYGSETVCAGESCIPRTSSYSPVSVCDGKGTCASMTQSCGDYTCTADGIRCRLSCATDTDCANSAFCRQASCVAKLSAGAVCSRSEQCTSAKCGGRCCAPGSSCTCAQPSPENLLKNPGFDTDGSGWSLVEVAVWTTVDAEGCPYSGSVRSPSNSGVPAQVVLVKPGVTYNLGASFSGYEANATYLCEVFVQSPSSSSYAAVSGTLPTPGVWETKTTTVIAPTDATGASIDCEIAGAFVDKMFLTPAPGTY